jgi:protocatechuate 3,4-dioxygenase, beta subunit
MAIPVRRRFVVAGAAAALAVPAFVRDALAQARLKPTPAQTEGPFYPVELPADSDADLLAQAGVPYTRGQAAWVEGRLTDTAGRALRGASVEIWQCDADGRYRHPRERAPADTAFQGFGRMAVEGDGSFRFRTLRPVAYPGRTPHIHAKVRMGGRELLTTQFYVEGEAGNERDGLWRSLSAADRAAVTRPFKSGRDGVLRAEFPLVVEA